MLITVLIYEHGFALCPTPESVSDEMETTGHPLRVVECANANDLIEATYEEGTDRKHHESTITKLWDAFIKGIS